MDRAHRKEKKADNFNVQEGGATFVGIRYTDDAKKDKVEGLDMMVHLSASLYLVAFQLVQMAESFKGENLEGELSVERNILRQKFVTDIFLDKKGQLCEPRTKQMKKCVLVIEEDLVGAAINELADIQIDLEAKMEEIIGLEEYSCATHNQYKQLFELRSTFQNVCIHTAVMLEIGALYLIHMSRGKGAPSYKIDLFRSEDELLHKIEDWECKMCGNALLVEDNELSGGGTVYDDNDE